MMTQCGSTKFGGRWAWKPTRVTTDMPIEWRRSFSDMGLRKNENFVVAVRQPGIGFVRRAAPSSVPRTERFHRCSKRSGHSKQDERSVKSKPNEDWRMARNGRSTWKAVTQRESRRVA